LPYVIGGAGFGYSDSGDEWGVSYLAGGGVLLIFRKRLAAGVEFSYQGFGLTDFEAGNAALTMQFAY
jgi:opacity protein-like surface antigen